MDKKAEMPAINRRIYELVEKTTGGNVSKFAVGMGVSPQKITRLFSPDPRNEKYPEPSLDIVMSISSGYNVSIDFLVNGIEGGVGDLELREMKELTPVEIESQEFLKDLIKDKEKENIELRKRIDLLTDELLAALKKS